ncbi:MAG: hypothetical protein KDJ65_08640 [Anaerolineae bacterium]|nr:hypothetical protein [Anaerolineae bacterium]
MNAFNQYVELGQKWANGQIGIGKGLFEAIRGIEQFDAGLIWDKSLAAYQAAVQGNLDAEVAGANLWFEEVVPVQAMPANALDVVKQMQDMTAEVTQAQQSAVDNLFDLLHKIDVKALPLTNIQSN